VFTYAGSASLSKEIQKRDIRDLRAGDVFIEGGYPGSNPRDADFFKQVKKLKLKNAKIASFGTTRKFGAKPSQDINLKVLLAADTPVVTLVGKAWDLHVRDDLRISQKANLEIIADSIAFMKKRVDEVIFDAEHFFDGFRDNPTMHRNAAAQDGGADWIVPAKPTAATTRRYSPGVHSRNRLIKTPSASTVTMTASWPWPRSPVSRSGPLKFKARSMALANVAATSI
jgi:isopropylmalate/homocitrate/citramalate synthase